VKEPETPRPFLNHSFKVSATPENLQLLKDMRMMAAKDGWSVSRLIREALVEYVKRHSPGNPQLALQHWSKNVPMPETMREKAKPEPDPMEGLRALPTDELIRQLAKMERADRRSDLRVSIEMLLQWMVVK
jgi:hypothetical protein